MNKEELINVIKEEIQRNKHEIRSSWGSSSDAQNRIAISNLYIALSNLVENGSKKMGEGSNIM